MKNYLYSIFPFVFFLFTTSVFGSDCNTGSNISAGLSLNKWVYSKSLNGENFSGGDQCEGPGNRPDSWMKFKAESTKMFVRVKSTGDLDLALEIYESCGGAQLACVNQTGAGAAEIVSLTGLTEENTYYIRVYHAGDVNPTTKDFTVSAAYIPSTRVQPQDCGIDDYTTNDIIKAIQPPGYITPIVYYQWRFEELEAPYNVYEKIPPNPTNPNFRLFWLNQIEYGRSYKVSVRLAVNPGTTVGDYGPSCIITMLDHVPPTQLEEQYESMVLKFCDVIGADKVEGAEQYRWEFFDYASNLTHSVVGDDDQRLLRVSKVPGLTLGKPYFVTVFAKHKNMESPVGDIRWVVLNNQVPNTGMKTSYNPCGATYPLNTDLQAEEICNAQSYTWRFKNVSQAQPAILYTREGGNRFIRLEWIEDLIIGDTYDVDVKGAQGNQSGDYSTVCQITIADIQTSGFNEENYFKFEEPDDEVVKNDFIPALDSEKQLEVVVLNNGTSAHKNVVFEVISKEVKGISQLQLYDINGRLISQKNEYIIADSNLIDWDIPNLTPGIYLLRVTDGQESLTQKVYIQ